MQQRDPDFRANLRARPANNTRRYTGVSHCDIALDLCGVNGTEAGLHSQTVPNPQAETGCHPSVVNLCLEETGKALLPLMGRVSI